MCVWVGIAMAVMAVAAKTMENHDAAKAEGQRADNARLQAVQYVKQNNYNQNNGNLANRAAFEEAVQQMTAKNMQGMQNLGAIDTSIAESGLKGNSMNRLRRSVEAQNDNEQMNITNQYKRNYATIFGNQLESQQQTIAAVGSLQQDTKKVSNGMQVLSTAMAGAQGFVQGYSMGTALKDAGAGFGNSGSTTAGGGTAASSSNTGSMGMSTSFKSYT